MSVAQIERVDSLEHFDAATRGQVRVFRRKIGVMADQLAASLKKQATKDLISAWLFKSGIGRNRIEPRLKAILPGVRWHPQSRYHGRTIMLGAYLRPSSAIRTNPEEPGETQDCVTVEYVLLDARGTRAAKLATYERNLWTLEIPDHALGRIVQRAPGVDLAEVIYAGHSEALKVGLYEIASDGKRAADGVKEIYVTEQVFTLATPPWGVFMCKACVGYITELPDMPVRFLRAVTWLDNDMAFNPPVKHGKPSLASSFLIPVGLEYEGDRIVVPK